MKPFSVMSALSFLLLAACATTQEMPATQPEIISMTALPPARALSNVHQLRVNVLFHVLNDGGVAEVRILANGNNPAWEAAAADSMKRWRFSPAPGNDSGAGRWIRYTLVVRIEEPVIMNLGELTAPDKETADSLYHLLQQGLPYDSLARFVAADTDLAALASPHTVDIATYPGHVRNELRQLAENGFTRPIRVGSRYVIYKRFPADTSRGLAQ